MLAVSQAGKIGNRIRALGLDLQRDFLDLFTTSAGDFLDGRFESATLAATLFQSERNEEARQLGFLDAADQLAAKDADVVDPAVWRKISEAKRRGDVLEGFASLGEDRRLAGKILPTADRGVAIVAVYFDRPGAPALRYAMRPEPMCLSLNSWSLAARDARRSGRARR